jgi:hypothetical protein
MRPTIPSPATGASLFACSAWLADLVGLAKRDAKDIPRTWDHDLPPGTASQADEHSIRRNYMVILYSNVVLATVTLIGMFNVILGEFVLPAAASLVLLLAG